MTGGGGINGHSVPAPHHRVVVIGSGFAGIGMGIRLLQEGIDDFVVLEKAADLGGTWRDNTYPGCRCDVPSHLYSFSFMPNPSWSSTYSKQPEIWEYLRRCALEGGVMPHLRFSTELLSAKWDEDARRWLLETSTGPVSADVLVAGTGPLSEPSIPEIPGLETFAGTAFHSAEWNHEHDLRGRRVALIGTGASAIQIAPQIQPEVERLTVYQRTAAWVIPHRDRPISRWEKVLYRLFPPSQRLVRGFVYMVREPMALAMNRGPRLLRAVERMGRRHLADQVSDPELRGKLRPSYRVGCKRILPSSDWYPALSQPNVELVTEPIAEVREDGILTADGELRELDTIILGTGFRIHSPSIAERVRGREGLLADAWKDGMEAYNGTAIAGFPNFFMLAGPNTGQGHTSVVYMLESQFTYLLDLLHLMDRDRVASAEVRPEVQRGFNSELQRRLRGTVWSSGCASWYLDEGGHNRAIWPGQTWNFRRRTRRFDSGSYVLEPAATTSASPAANSSTSSAVVSQEHISRTVRDGSSQT